MEIPETLPASVKTLLAECNNIISSSPTEGSQILLGQNGRLESTDISTRSSFISCALINPKRISWALDNFDVPGNIFHTLGHPMSGTVNGVEQYLEEDIPERYQEIISPFMLEQDDPRGIVHFIIKPDFLIYYNLFPINNQHNFVYHDHLRGFNNIITQEKTLDCCTIKIQKNYLLDYLYVRKKALIIGYYYYFSRDIDEGDLPKGYRNSFEFKTDDRRSTIIVWRDSYDYNAKICARLDMYKIIDMPDEPSLGPYGLLPSPPDIEILTTEGSANISELLSQGLDAFYTKVYFSSEVLLKYESDRKFHVSDEGGVGYEGVWSVLRGILRLGDEVLYANVQDMFEALPYEEWEHWKSYSLKPLSIEEHKELLDIENIQQKANILLREIRSFVLGIKFFMTYYTGREFVSVYEIQERKVNPIFQEIKKTFTRGRSKAVFLDRITELSKIVVDCLSTTALTNCIDVFYPDAKKSTDGQPKGSLKLLLALLEIKIIVETITKHFPESEHLSKVQSYYNLVQTDSLDTSGDFVLAQIFKKCQAMRNSFLILFTVYSLRSKGGGAHIGSESEFKKAMSTLEFEESPSNFLPIYRKILDDLIRFYATS